MNIIVFCVTRRQNFAQNIIENLQRQRRPPDGVVLLTHSDRPGNECWAPFRDVNAMLMAADSSRVYGAVLNTAASTAAGWALQFGSKTGMICNFDDDEYYGPDYLAEIEKAKTLHPDAILIGKHAYYTVWPEQRNRPPEFYEGAKPDENGRCVWLAGATLSICAEHWRKLPSLRYPEQPAPVDGHFIQAAYRAWRVVECPELTTVPRAPFYSTGHANFLAQRFTNPDHGHTWKDPRD